MEIRQRQHFVRIVEVGSVSRASRSLHVAEVIEGPSDVLGRRDAKLVNDGAGSP